MSDIFAIMSDEMKESRVTVRFSAELRQRLKATARRTGTRESDLVRRAVERELDAEPPLFTAWEIAMKAGVIGAVRNAPSDLSTNPKHFEGFGRS
jgi:predicted DNA-binding protein